MTLGYVRAVARAEGNEETVKLIGRICPLLCVFDFPGRPAGACATAGSSAPCPDARGSSAGATCSAAGAREYRADAFDLLIRLGAQRGPLAARRNAGCLASSARSDSAGKAFAGLRRMVTIPMKGSTRLELSYLTLNDRGNALAPTDLGLFGGTIAQGEPLARTTACATSSCHGTI